jgi:hypothetical protein
MDWSPAIDQVERNPTVCQGKIEHTVKDYVCVTQTWAAVCLFTRVWIGYIDTPIPTLTHTRVLDNLTTTFNTSYLPHVAESYLVCGRVFYHRLTGTFVACNSRHLKSWVANFSEDPL